MALDNSLRYREEQEAIRVRDNFLSVASHELKTPLTGLTLQAQMLERTLAPTLDGENRAVLSRLKRNTGKLSELIDRLLDVSRIRTQHLKLEPAIVDLGALVLDVVTRFTEQARAAGSDLEADIEPGVIGRWDRGLVEQVAVNLIGNAIKYGRSRPIRVRVSREEDDAVLSIADQGIGIAEHDISSLFEPYTRLGW
jgi:signal transduction histidine kinase